MSVYLTDDFVVSDESTLDDDDEEGIVSTYPLCGPPGAGKTAAVYALASELGYKVGFLHFSIEVSFEVGDFT